MKKKTNIKTIIRQIVREEVAMAIKEVVTELKQPSLSSNSVSQPKRKPKKKVVENKSYTNNSVLNDILNETAGEEYPTMGGGTYDSSRANEVLASSYGDMMNGTPKPNGDQMIASMGVNPDTVDETTKNVIGRDYRDLMKAIDKKRGKK